MSIRTQRQYQEQIDELKEKLENIKKWYNENLIEYTEVDFKTLGRILGVYKDV